MQKVLTLQFTFTANFCQTYPDAASFLIDCGLE